MNKTNINSNKSNSNNQTESRKNDFSFRPGKPNNNTKPPKKPKSN